MSDPFQNHASGLDAPASSAFAITPGSSDLAVFTRCIYVGTSGDLELTMIDGSTATIKNAAVGYHPLAGQEGDERHHGQRHRRPRLTFPST